LFEAVARRVSTVVTGRPLLVIVVMLLLTGGMVVGMTQVDMENQTDIDTGVFEQTEVGQALSYTEDSYLDDEESTAVSSVYLRPENGNALSRSSLVAALEYQETVLGSETVTSELIDGQAVTGPPNAVGRQLAGEDATLTEQRTAIETASNEAFTAAVRAVYADPDRAGRYLPRSYEPGTATAESLRMTFEFEQATVTQQQEPLPAAAAQQVLFETAQNSETTFTMGTFAQESFESAQITDVFWLLVPPALLLVLGVLAVAYRDLVDILLGFVGVSVSLVWFFGILGWLGIPAGFASIVGPILILALSIDFGLHVFMRYREQRDGTSAPSSNEDEEEPTENSAEHEAGGEGAVDVGVQTAMYRSSRSVMIAFLLVAVTAGVGFMANITNPVGFIRAFGLVITLGVLGAVVVFVTLVPALKLSIDRLLERRGINRRKAALGTTGRLRPLLSSGVSLARRGALVVVVLSVLAGGLGVLAYTDLDRQGFQQDLADEDSWQTKLPEPLGWSAHETDYRQNLDYVRANYQSDDERERATAFLLRGNVTNATALQQLQAGTAAVRDSDVTFEQDGSVPVLSPLVLIRQGAVANDAFASLVAGVAESDDEFADLVATLTDEHEPFADAMETAQPAPVEGDLTVLYDALYDRAPDEAGDVLERTDGGYRSMRLLVPIDQETGINERGDEVHAIADVMEGNGLSAVPVDFATVSNAGLGEIADSILWTMLLAFGGVAVVLAGMYWVERRQLLLGVVTVIPIVLVVGLVFAGMYLFGVPLTFITAFLVSITIGLGIDYNIHISNRFAQELDRGQEPVAALETTVRGTGGALLGSVLTSGAVFATLLLHPSVVFQSFGLIVVLALVLSFVVSVLVLPSFLLLWARLGSHGAVDKEAENQATVPTQD
jgi:Predicted exporters of the RND superfamily